MRGKRRREDEEAHRAGGYARAGARGGLGGGGRILVVYHARLARRDPLPSAQVCGPAGGPNRSSTDAAEKPTPEMAEPSPPSVYSCCSVSSAPADDSTYANHLTGSQQRERKLQAARERQAAEEAAELLATPGERGVAPAGRAHGVRRPGLGQRRTRRCTRRTRRRARPRSPAVVRAADQRDPPRSSGRARRAAARARDAARGGGRSPAAAKTPPPVDGPGRSASAWRSSAAARGAPPQEQRAAQPTV